MSVVSGLFSVCWQRSTASHTHHPHHDGTEGHWESFSCDVPVRVAFVGWRVCGVDVCQA